MEREGEKEGGRERHRQRNREGEKEREKDKRRNGDNLKEKQMPDGSGSQNLIGGDSNSLRPLIG